jgi:pyruvate/2-oxoglutarate dehydrogenase complex dihydrolipoamide dehydrogenase (E3) component
MTQSIKTKQWHQPKQFDANLIVIGAGSGGLVTAYIAAAVKARVVLVEKQAMGGDCLNTGCVPSKALIRSAKFLSHITRSAEFGIKKVDVEFDFSQIMARVQQLIKTIEPHDSVSRYTELGVNVIKGTAKIISPWQVEITTNIGQQILSTRSIVIAAGARPFIPPIPGLNTIGYRTSDTIWSMHIKPKRLLILGGGAIGCELAQAFARLGIEVTQIERLPRIMIREDIEVSQMITEKFQREGIKVLVEHKAKQFIVENGEKILIADYQGKDIRIAFDEVLLALGRVANVSNYGIEAMEISLSARKAIEVNAFQATNYPNIYACGDVTGSYQFTHVAAHQAWYAAVNALFGHFKKFKTDYTVIPWATFTDPEVARVGLNEQEAKQQGIAYELSIYGMDELDRAIVESETQGFIKVLTVPKKDKILGVTIVGENAGDLITEFVLAMKYNLGLNKILATIHIYPTRAEANKYVAGVWKRQHQPKTLLKWIEYYHCWRRG